MKRQVTAEWTIMIYMAGDNPQERWGCENIDNEFSNLGSTENVQVVGLFDRSPSYATKDGDWSGAQIFHMYRGMTAVHGIEDWGSQNMGDPETLVKFVAWAKERSPATKYLLVFQGPGGFWHLGYSMLDETSSFDSLDLDEVKAVLPDLGNIDLVAYDSSYSASVEVAALWHGKAEAIVFSEDTVVGANGIDYAFLLHELNLAPTMSAQELAVVASQSAALASTFSCVALDARFDTFLLAINSWGNALLRAVEHWGAGRTQGTQVSLENRAKFRQAFSSAKSFGNFSSDKDILSAVSAIRSLAYKEPHGVASDKVIATGKALVLAQSGVVLDYHSSGGEAWGHGMTLSIISCLPTANSTEYADFYRALDFVSATSFDIFIDSFAVESDCDY